MRTLRSPTRPVAFFFAVMLVLGAALQALGVATAEDVPPAAVTPAVVDLSAVAEEARPTRTPGLPSLAHNGGGAVIIPIDGTIDLGLAPFVQRVLDENNDADVIILDVNTFGGRVDAAVQIRDAVLAADPHVIAYVHPRAISAGALISYAADSLVFASGGSMGAATPIQVNNGEAEAVGEKMVSYMRTEMRTTAEATGRNGLVAEAMVDASIEVEGVIDGDKLLTASTELATRIGLADGTAESMDDLLQQVGLSDATQQTAESSWAEEVARILTDPTLSGMLMSIGFLGLMVELYSPGFGWAGGVGVVCLSAFFMGHMVVNLAGFEELLLLLAGFVALGIEVFVIPGFGVVGVLGLLLILTGLTFSLTALPLDVSWSLGYLKDALERVLVSLSVTAVGLVIAAQVIPVRVLPSWLVLRTSLGEGQTADATPDYHSAPDQQALMGLEGVAHTVLRPSGKARIEGRLIDVVSESRFIQAGDPVRVVQVEGMRVVVDLIEEIEEAAPAAGA